MAQGALGLIILDANALITFLRKDDSSANLRSLLDKSTSLPIGIPTPALAEFMVKDENESRTKQLLRPSSRIKGLAFDEKAAIVAAKIYKDNQKILPHHHEEPKQKIKVDVQILAIAMTNNAMIIVTNDKGIKNMIKRLNLPIRVFDYIEDSFIDQMTKLDMSEPTSTERH